ncbi:hypothetical protein Cgig2_011503 [Carnegiea gigantea]|uniref:DUF4283 domain-containing protein n=1 Tax=Carnegiea gigantea TaxID=171969 RepID=A0A9Q1GU01_9CARY|nr:hypothetical protein Cgig2_011503 [Carnegiea gigantea]
MEGLEVARNRLKLKEAEGEVLEYDEEVPLEKQKEIAVSLVGKLFTQNNINVKAMKLVLQVSGNRQRAWKDREFFLNEGPWASDGSLWLLKEWMGLKQLSKIQFQMARFWVKAFDIPMCWGIRVEPLLGVRNIACMEQTNIHKPLRRGINVKVDGHVLGVCESINPDMPKKE